MTASSLDRTAADVRSTQATFRWLREFLWLRQPRHRAARLTTAQTLIAIAAAALVIALCAAWAIDRATAERRLLELQFRHAAEQSSHRLDDDIVAAHTLLADLARTIATQDGALAVFSDRASRADLPDHLSVSLFDSAGCEVFNTLPSSITTAEQAPRSSGQRAWARAVIDARREQKALPLVEWGGQSIMVALPVVAQGALNWLLVATIESTAAQLRDSIADTGGASTANVALLDRDGGLLAASAPLSRLATDSYKVLSSTIPPLESGVVRENLQGENFWVAYSRSRYSDWLVALVVPAAPSLPLRHALPPALVASGMLLLIAGTAHFGRRRHADPDPPVAAPDHAIAAPTETLAIEPSSRLVGEMRGAECFIALDGAGRVAEFNSEAADWIKEIGGDLPAHVGRPLRDAIPRARASRVWAELDRLVDSRASADFDLRSTIRPDAYLEVRFHPVDRGFHLFFRHVTRPRAPERSLPISQKMLQSTIDSLSACIVVLDRHGVIVRTNRAWRRLMQQCHCKCPEHGVGSRYVDIHQACHPERRDAESMSLAFKAVLAGTRRTFRMECDWPVTNGRCLFQIRASLCDQGDGPQLIVVHEDVSEIQQAAGALQRVTESLLKSQEDERRRIARELHDSTAQHLAAAKMLVDRLRQKLPPSGTAVASYPDDIDAMLDRALAEIRNLSYLLHPPLLGEAGLGVALRSYVAGFAKRSGLDISIETPSKSRPVSPDVETALFRVVQEALANIHRHSGSRTGRVRLRIGRLQAVLQVEDDGRAAESMPNAPAIEDLRTVGVGIPGMRARMRQLGGTLTVRQTTTGTIVRAVVPLSAPDPQRIPHPT